MDYEKLIKKEFKFLKKYGFKIANYSRNFEIEIDFSYRDISIGLNFVDHDNQAVGCGIKVGNKSENLLRNTMFDIGETAKLKELISDSASAEEQIKIYAQFILQNIDRLLNYKNDGYKCPKKEDADEQKEVSEALRGAD